MTNAAAKLVWLTNLLGGLKALALDRPHLMYDNKSVIFLSQNPFAQKRAKHLDLDYQFVRELVCLGRF